MDDTELYVDYEKLSDDGEILINNSKTIDDNIVSINDLIAKNWTTWLGPDSNEYISNLNKFIEELAKYSSEIHKIGSFMQTVAGDYSSSVDTCVRGIEADE